MSFETVNIKSHYIYIRKKFDKFISMLHDEVKACQPLRGNTKKLRIDSSQRSIKLKPAKELRGDPCSKTELRDQTSRDKSVLSGNFTPDKNEKVLLGSSSGYQPDEECVRHARKRMSPSRPRTFNQSPWQITKFIAE